jgi:exodeoxyribonuclease V alpha subunit
MSISPPKNQQPTNTGPKKDEFLTGVIERITFHAEDSGYTVARMKVSGFQDLVTITGNFSNIQAGQTLKLTGYWQNHPKHGQQFQVVQYTETKPATLTGLEKYLGSGLIKGVGPVTAKRIVAYFGLETLEVIESRIDRLIEVEGIGRKRVKQIQKAWEAQKAIKEVMVFLQGHGVSTLYAVKIFKQYGDQAIATVTNNPYQLAEDIFGIGFLTADKIAQNLGVSPWSKFRYQSGILHVLGAAAEEGHCFLPLPELIKATVQLLSSNNHEADPEAVKTIIEGMEQEKTLLIDKGEGGMPLCYKPTFFYTEQNLAQLLLTHLSRPVAIDRERVKNWIDRFTQTKGIQLSQLQLEAVEMAASSRILILTGGPGTGKTMTTKVITALWKAMGKTIALAAPTGRAAKRLSEMAGLEAKTIHRLLEFDPATRGFKRGLDNLLPCDALIVDEASMLDLFLAHSLIKAIPQNLQLLIVGDQDQLPSVGPGNILGDLIDSRRIPVVRLTQVFRQAASSAIIRVAHQVNKGQYPQLEAISEKPQSDCLWHNGGTEPEHGVQIIGELLQGLIPQFGFNPTTDVQVLCPMTRGVVGTRNLNGVLQQLLNPPSPTKAEINRGGMVFREGDRMIQLKNDYDREVYNGDLGTILRIDPTEQEMLVQIDEREVTYDYADLNEITLAYSISIHKSQGSEYPVVILPLYTQHYVMLSRNLVYTGITRGKKLVILVGSSKAIAIAVKQHNEQQRYTRLRERLLKCNQ